MLLNLARGEALYGQGSVATRTLSQALQLSDSKEIKRGAAGVMVLNAQEPEAQKVINDLLRDYPTDTFLNELDVPLALAASQSSLGQAEAALRTLDRVKPFEFGTTAGFLPNYIRAVTYVHLRRPEDAAGQFSAVQARRGVSPLSPILVASQLDLARAYALRRDVGQTPRRLRDPFRKLEKCRPGSPPFEASQGRVQKAAVVPGETVRTNRSVPDKSLLD